MRRSDCPPLSQKIVDAPWYFLGWGKVTVDPPSCTILTYLSKLNALRHYFCHLFCRPFFPVTYCYPKFEKLASIPLDFFGSLVFGPAKKSFFGFAQIQSEQQKPQLGLARFGFCHPVGVSIFPFKSCGACIRQYLVF